MTGCEKFGCTRKVENKCTKIYDEPNNTPPGIGFSFVMCHLLVSQEADGFQLLVDLESLIFHRSRVDSRGRVENARIHKNRTSYGDKRHWRQRVTRHRIGYLTSRSTQYRQRLEDNQIAHSTGAWFKK